SKARGQFCIDSNEGVRLGYGENAKAWTCGAVYRNNTTGEVHGYLGSSERQATTSTFAFVSKDRDVYFNGDGPTRRYVYEVPGGTGYQQGQIGAERLFDITWGEDVAPGVVDGTYLIVNQLSGMLLTGNGESRVTTAKQITTGTSQQWKVKPGYTTGDMSYWFIDNVTTSDKSHLNVLNISLENDANVICWQGGGDGDHLLEEQWYVKYAQDGYYYIISRLSNKYLYCTSTSSGAEVRLKEGPAYNARSKAAFLWRLQPIDSKVDTRAPAAPTELNFEEQEAGVELSWTAPDDNDPLTYIVLRAEGTADEYNTIARGVSTTSYTDNTAEAGKRYYYKVKAVDYAGNRSKASSEVVTAIEAPVAVKEAGQDTWYDTNGLPATPASRGILIQDGKKVLKRP
ncbi:MAG: RICIN domain-containing protein, partial [Bacteroidaceae bacterium]|nr:RICIN domain-containing protein [Bacteroidaceae bacterium]